MDPRQERELLEQVAEAVKVKGELKLTLDASRRLARHMIKVRRKGNKQIWFERNTSQGWLRLDCDLFFSSYIVTLETSEERETRTRREIAADAARRAQLQSIKHQRNPTSATRDPNPRERQELHARIRREQGEPHLAPGRSYRSC